jgi:hypothetical protein
MTLLAQGAGNPSWGGLSSRRVAATPPSAPRARRASLYVVLSTMALKRGNNARSCQWLLLVAFDSVGICAAYGLPGRAADGAGSPAPATTAAAAAAPAQAQAQAQAQAAARAPAASHAPTLTPARKRRGEAAPKPATAVKHPRLGADAAIPRPPAPAPAPAPASAPAPAPAPAPAAKRTRRESEAATPLQSESAPALVLAKRPRLTRAAAARDAAPTLALAPVPAAAPAATAACIYATPAEIVSSIGNVQDVVGVLLSGVALCDDAADADLRDVFRLVAARVVGHLVVAFLQLTHVRHEHVVDARDNALSESFP